MSKYKGRKKKKILKIKKQATEQDAVGTNGNVVSSDSSSYLRKPKILLFLLGFVLFANTIPFEHALDDKLAITHNQFTKKGIKGIPDICSNDLLVGFYGKKRNLLAGSRYRPLSLVTFAIEWSLFGPSPGIKDPVLIESKLATLAHLSHFINSLLYGLTGIVLFLVLMQLFPDEKDKAWYFSVPFIASVLYLTHPLHTEVVANIKSRDELMSVLGALATLFYTMKYLATKNNKNLWFAAILFILSLFAKETAITFLGIIPLAIYFFTKHSIKENLIACLPLGFAAIIYVSIRYAVVGSSQLHPVPELLNDPYLYATTSEKIATIFYTMGIYLKLLLFPHPLTHDYYPWHPVLHGSFTWGHFPYLNWSSPAVVISFLLYLILFITGIAGIRKKKLLSFCILQFMISFLLFSNLFFAIGTFMNERFMYLPSLGYCLFLGWIIGVKLPKLNKSIKLAGAVFLVLALAFSIKTVTRNAAWRNDFTLATTDVLTSVNSTKVNMSAGLALVHQVENNPEIAGKTKILDKAISYLNHSIQLYPNYIQSLVILGSAYFLKDNFEKAYIYLKQALKVNFKFNDARKNMYRLGLQCEEKGRNTLAVQCYNEVLKYYPEDTEVLGALGKVYARGMNQPDKALQYLEKAYELDPNNTDIIQKIGVVYATSGKTSEAIEMFKKGLAINSNNAHIIMNIGIAYKSIGDDSLGQQYLDRAFQIDPSLKQ